MSPNRLSAPPAVVPSPSSAHHPVSARHPVSAGPSAASPSSASSRSHKFWIAAAALTGLLAVSALSKSSLRTVQAAGKSPATPAGTAPASAPDKAGNAGKPTPSAGAASSEVAFPADGKVDWHRHVAPLVWKHCAGCHRAGEIGPFPLLTYADAAKRADFLAEVVADKRMPPWKAEPGFADFHDARLMSADEVKIMTAWAKAGAPEGDARHAAAPPKFPEGWQLGEPDLVLEMPEAYTLAAGGKDVQQCFAIPMPLDGDRTVAAVEFRPGNAKVVHHAIFYLDSSGAGRRKDAAEEGPGWKSFGGPGIIPTGGLGAWVPGQTVRRLPDGMGKFVKKGSDLVLQIHYHPSGKVETDRSRLGIHFTKGPVNKLVGAVAVRGNLRYIPAGTRRHHVSGESEALPVDVDALSIAPHMHLLGKEMKVVAHTPDGRQVPLIWIRDWDFNWQGSYHYRNPVRLPKGTVIKLDAWYDNSSDNPRNPSNPPKASRWGEQTTDEMCLLGIQVTTDDNADLRKIARMKGAGLATILAGGLRASDIPDGMPPVTPEKGTSSGSAPAGKSAGSDKPAEPAARPKLGAVLKALKALRAGKDADPAPKSDR